MSHPWGVVYRPREISEIVGNVDTVDSLLESMKDKNLSTRILIDGQTGAGKTTLAYLLTEYFTGQPYDPGVDSLCVNEINCASERGLDMVRETIERVKMRPMVGNRHVVLLDEAQELTKGAFKALYKPLESESDTVWIVVSMESDRIDPTVRTRLNRYTMVYPSVDDLVNLAEDVHKAEKFNFKFPDVAITKLAEEVRNPREFLNCLQTLYDKNAFTGDAVNKAILITMRGSEDTTSIDNLLSIVHTGRATKAVNIMSVYLFWCELLTFAICDAQGIPGIEPAFVRKMFKGRINKAVGEHDLVRILDKLHRGRSQVNMGGCDGVGIFVSLFGLKDGE